MLSDIDFGTYNKSTEDFISYLLAIGREMEHEFKWDTVLIKNKR